MSLRSDIFEYMNKSPRSGLPKVKSKFPGHNNSTVSRYYFDYKKKRKEKDKAILPEKLKAKTQSKIRVKKTIKQHICGFLDRNPNASLRDVYQVFPEVNKKTIGNYRLKWKKEQLSISANSGEKTKIFDYLDAYPDSNLNDLRKAFPGTGNHLITIFRSWKSRQKKNRQEEQTSAGLGGNDEYMKQIETQQETIESQKETIEKQKTRIVALKTKKTSAKRFQIGNRIKEFIVEKILKS